MALPLPFAILGLTSSSATEVGGLDSFETGVVNVDVAALEGFEADVDISLAACRLVRMMRKTEVHDE